MSGMSSTSRARSQVSAMHRWTGPPASRWECSMRPCEGEGTRVREMTETMDA